MDGVPNVSNGGGTCDCRKGMARSTGELSGISPEMPSTRTAFGDMTGCLLPKSLPMARTDITRDQNDNDNTNENTEKKFRHG